MSDEIISVDELEGLQKGTEVNIEQMPIIIRVPKEVANMNITCSLFDRNGKVHEVTCNMNLSEIQTARQDFIDFVGDDDYDALYVLTDEGRAYAEELAKREGKTF